MADETFLKRKYHLRKLSTKTNSHKYLTLPFCNWFLLNKTKSITQEY